MAGGGPRHPPRATAQGGSYFDVAVEAPPARRAATDLLPCGVAIGGPSARRLSALGLARVDTLLELNLGCDRPWALRPRSPETLRALLEAVHQHYERAAPDSTLDTEASNWRWWLRYTGCSELWLVPCQPIRPDRRQLSFEECILEEALWAGAVPWIHLRMKSRAGVVGAAKPSSVMNVLRGCRRAHARQGVDTVSLASAVRATQGLLRQYVALHGVDALLPKRKEPLTNSMIKRLLGLLAAGAITPVDGGRPLDWGATRYRSLPALFATLAQTGMRKAEISLGPKVAFGKTHLSMANVRWIIGGVLYESPTLEQLRQLRDGDYALLRPPPSKADQFSLHWGASTIYLMFFTCASAHPICAARELAAEEMRRQVAPADRETSPLFVCEGNSAWRHGALAEAFGRMLTVVCGSVSAASCYSVHSFRVYLACALLSAGASNGTIQTMLRWRSDDALRIYARINDYKYAEWLQRAAVAEVSSVRTTTQAMVQRMEIAAVGATRCREAGFQAHWMEAAAAADGDFADGPRPPRTDNDDVVAEMRGDMATLLATAERADEADAAEFAGEIG
jgi:integrase